MKKKQFILGAIVLLALVAFWIWGRNRIHFDFALFRDQLAHANWWKIGLALGCIYAGYIFRSLRWAMLLRHHKKVSPFTLLGTQVIGFTAIALIGRVADPVRPYLVSKKTGLTLSSQVATYVVERLFDAGAFALIVSIALFSVPMDVHASAPGEHHMISPFVAEFLKRYGGLILTVFGTLFLVGVRFYGEKIAHGAERVFTPLSVKFAHAVAHKIRAFHSGLDMIRSIGDFLWVAGTSLAMWGLITVSYLETMQAFTANHELASVSFPQCVGLMVASGGASALQLPIIGWFTQIGIVATAMSKFIHVAAEPATACAAALLVVTFLSVVPVGLAWAQFENVSLRKVAEQSEHDVEVLEEDEEATEQ